MHTLKSINQKTRLAYDKAAEKYYEMFFDELEKKEFDKIILDDFSKYFDDNSIVCDAGCGPCGHVADYISKKGIKIIGVDISEKCVEIAKKYHPGIQFETGDFSNLNYNDNYFDGIISYYSIVDTPKRFVKKVLNEFNRVLKDSGYLLLVVKEGDGEGFQNDLLGIETEIYFSLFTKKEIEKYLLESGFEIIRIEERTPYRDEININRIFSISKKIS